MSIALSVVVHPSRRLGLLAAGMGALGLASALAIGAGWVGDLAPMLRLGLAALAAGLVGLASLRLKAGRKTHTLDISANGQICLAEHTAGATRVAPDGQSVRLLPDPTLWPGLMLLRLQAIEAELPRADAQGRAGGRANSRPAKVTTLAILPDSLPPDAFRALSVAMRWIAAHNAPARQDPGQEKNFAGR